MMANKEKAKESLLPDTGIGKEWEKKLSPVFIETKNYGTRCTTFLEITNNTVVFAEKTYPTGKVNAFEFEISTDE